VRRFSQRNPLVTLSDINITPLLDLAFVLLIIFVITTPMLEQGMDLKLPKGGKADRKLSREDFRTVEVSAQGIYTFDRQHMTLDQVESELVRAQHSNPSMVIFIRGDENTPWKLVFGLMDRLSNRGLTNFSARAEPPGAR